MPDAISGGLIGTVDGGDLDYEDEAEPGPDWGPGARLVDTSEMDAAALEARRNASTPKPQPTPEEQDQLVHGCYDGILANWMVHGAADLLVRELAARLGVPTGEAERLIDAEIRRGAARKK